MNVRRRRSAFLLVACLAVGSLQVISAVPTSAHFVDSNVSIHADDKSVRPNQKVTFFGRLRTEGHKGRCQDGARIFLHRKGQGVVDSDRTDAQGEWSIRHDPEPNRGKFFARYHGSGRFGYQDRHKCGADRSDTIRIRRAGA